LTVAAFGAASSIANTTFFDGIRSNSSTRSLRTSASLKRLRILTLRFFHGPLSSWSASVHTLSRSKFALVIATKRNPFGKRRKNVTIVSVSDGALFASTNSKNAPTVRS
jgi:hypothetical protein